MLCRVEGVKRVPFSATAMLWLLCVGVEVEVELVVVLEEEEEEWCVVVVVVAVVSSWVVRALRAFGFDSGFGFGLAKNGWERCWVCGFAMAAELAVIRVERSEVMEMAWRCIFVNALVVLCSVM